MLGVVSKCKAFVCTVMIAGCLLVFSATTTLAQNLRSSLYPEDWQPNMQDAQGRFLHDFSYAGYHNGEMPIPKRNDLEVFDVVSGYGADNTGATDATRAIQDAINAAAHAKGGIVFLPEGLYKCDGVLEITGNNIILRGAGPDKTRVYFTKVKNMTGKSHIQFKGKLVEGESYPLVENGQNLASTITVLDGAALEAGTEASVGWEITPAFVAEHGMEDYWLPFRDQWKPVFRRSVVSVDRSGSSPVVTLDVPLRYISQVRDKAALRIESGYLRECGVEDIAISNAVESGEAWTENRNHCLSFMQAKDCWIRNVHSFASPHPDADGYHLQSSGIQILDSKRITVQDCVLGVAQNRGGGGNGYLYEIMTSNEVLTVDCKGYDGRHNFIQNWDFGTAGCVWLRCESSGGKNLNNSWIRVGPTAYSEFHHALAMGCLIDSCTLDDGWLAGNRQHYSSGAGHTSTQCVFWNNRGNGTIHSWQYGMGYIIGTTDLSVKTTRPYITTVNYFEGTEPEDYTELLDQGAQLQPQSLYEDQLKRRIK